jgi:shikimate dehydrogenase
MKRIPTSRTKLFGLLGFPVRHSLSSLMHNSFFRRKRIDAVYLNLEVRPQDLSAAFAGLRAVGAAGFNLTIPHKESALRLLDGVSDRPGLASRIGAVNTVKNRGGRLIGYNTDAQGFVLALRRLGFEPQGKRALLLGAGGAGRAVAFALLKHGVAGLSIYDLDGRRAQRLTKDLKRNFLSVIRLVQDPGDLEIGEAELLVNATPIGMKGTDGCPVDPQRLHTRLFVYDLVYNPHGRRYTPLVEAARRKNLSAHDGLWMLVYQAVLAQKIWFAWPDSQEDEISRIFFAALAKEGYTPC